MQTTKRLLSLLLTVAMMCSMALAMPLTSSAAESGKCGDNLTWTLGDNGTLTISGTGKMYNYSNNNAPWYNSRDKITAVKIDDGVTNIGNDAFYNCTKFTSVTIPDSVTSIGNDAFYNCTRLTSVAIPDGVTSIESGVFGYCSSLTSITIPNSVTSIGNDAFRGCLSLTSITIPDGVTSIGKSAFAICSSLTSVTIPDSVTNVGELAFRSCRALTSITIPDGVTSIERHAFSNCTSLTSVTIPNSVTSIGDSAFEYCTSLTSVTIPDSVTNVGSSAFYSCSSLTSITIPDSVTSVGRWAFSGCTSLTSITIPDSVTSIGEDAFYETAYYNQPANWAEEVLYIGNHLIEVKEPLSGAFNVRAGTKTLADRAFYGYASLTSVTIPDSVTSIGGYAFYGCSSLTGVTIPDSVTSIGDWAFAECKLLSSITIPDSVTSIGERAFECCESLKSVTIPDSVTSIGKRAFIGCDKCTIYGNAESYAQEYANDNYKPFVAGTTVGDILFIDVVPDKWYVSAVRYALDNSLFVGVSDNEFAPDAAMSRAMLVTVLWRLEGRPTASAENPFIDVPTGKWYTNAVIWASESHVVSGTGEGKFSPDDNITREQMATILYRYAKNKEYDITASTDLNTFADGSDASSFAGTALSWACGAGLILGSEGKLLPQDGASRAQVAAILMRYMQKIVK